MFTLIRTFALTSALASTLFFPTDVLAKKIPNKQIEQITQTAKPKVQVDQLSAETLTAEITKPAVVRIAIDCKAKITFNNKTYNSEVGGHGSGFFVNPNGYIVTNAHVVNILENPEECKQALSRDVLDQILRDGASLEELLTKYSTPEEFIKDLKFGQIETIKEVVLTNGDRLPFTVVVSGNQEDSGRDVAIIKVKLRNAPSLLLADSNRVQIQQNITAVGYPGVGDIPKQQGAGYNEPSFTNGKVSARKFINGTSILQVSAAIAPGNSGGPVINDKGEVVGISAFTLSDQSGFDFIVASNTIKDFLQQAGVSNDEGVVTQRYRKGLNLYNQGQCKLATQELIAVQRLFPQHPSVDKILQKCGG